MKISVIYLNFNRKDDISFSLDRMLDQDYNDYEIIVVDQGSTDGSVDLIQSKFSNIKLYALKKNLGVSGGRNYGASKASGEYLLFIDDDAHFFSNNSLTLIVDFLSKNKDVGIVGFQVNDVNGKLRDWVYGKRTKKYYNNIFETQQYVGCGHVIKRELFTKVNGYSDELFFWGEEIEFCIKTFISSNYSIIYNPEIKVIHRVSDSSRLYWSDKRTYYKVRNRFLLINNYFKQYFIAKSFYYIYYGLGYLLKAIINNATKQYIKGFMDARKMRINNSKKINRVKLKKYFKMHLKQLIGKVQDYNT